MFAVINGMARTFTIAIIALATSLTLYADLAFSNKSPGFDEGGGIVTKEPFPRNTTTGITRERTKDDIYIETIWEHVMDDSLSFYLSSRTRLCRFIKRVDEMHPEKYAGFFRDILNYSENIESRKKTHSNLWKLGWAVTFYKNYKSGAWTGDRYRKVWKRNLGGEPCY
ncbi:MAG: hypothetical protein WBO55_15360 [Rhizobiaceae bacterium]